MARKRVIRALVGKVGLDGHDRGARVVAIALKEAGMEVIYTGLRQTPEAIVQTAIQEDVDVIGLSSMCGAHNYLFHRVSELLSEKGVNDILLVAGGIFPEEDIPLLQKMGFKCIFRPGTPTKEIVGFIEKNIRKT